MDEVDSENSGKTVHKTAVFFRRTGRRRLEQGRIPSKGDLGKSVEATKAATASEDHSLKRGQSSHVSTAPFP